MKDNAHRNASSIFIDKPKNNTQSKSIDNLNEIGRIKSDEIISDMEDSKNASADDDAPKARLHFIEIRDEQ